MCNFYLLRGGIFCMKVNSNLKLTEKDKEKAILFLQELIRINSTNPVGNELEVATVIKKYTDQTGLHIDIQPFEEKRGNVLVHLKGKNSKLKPLVFSEIGRASCRERVYVQG